MPEGKRRNTFLKIWSKNVFCSGTYAPTPEIFLKFLLSPGGYGGGIVLPSTDGFSGADAKALLNSLKTTVQNNPAIGRAIQTTIVELAAATIPGLGIEKQLLQANQVTLLNFTTTFYSDGYKIDLNVVPGASIGRSYGETPGRYLVSVGMDIKSTLGGQLVIPLADPKATSVGWNIGMSSPVNLTIQGKRHFAGRSK